MWNLIHGDCVEEMKKMEPGSVDAIVCDPPYGLKFMSREFDDLGDGPAQQAWHLRWAKEAIRVLKPGGYLLAFGGSRTSHRLVCAVEDAGFEIRDSVMWIYGSGFPKSHNVSKAIDKVAGAKREVVGSKLGLPGYSEAPSKGRGSYNAVNDGSWQDSERECQVTAPATEDAQEWDGWGSALKPAHEPICMARKPFKGTLVDNVLEHGTGALNIDGCRVGTSKEVPGSMPKNRDGHGRLGKYAVHAGGPGQDPTVGRWPANVMLGHHPDCEKLGERKVTSKSGSVSGREPSGPQWGGRSRVGFEKHAGNDGLETVNDWDCVDGCPVKELDLQSGVLKSGALDRGRIKAQNKKYGNAPKARRGTYCPSSGGASRFFYQAKASRKERNGGLDRCEIVNITVSWEHEVQEVRLLVDTEHSPPRVTGVYGMSDKGVQGWNTLLFGREEEGPSLKGCRYTTSTKTSSTTGSKTWNWLMRLLTSGSTADVLNGTGLSISHVENVGSMSLLTSITSEAMGLALGAVPAASRTLLKISASEENANNKSPGRFVNNHVTVKPVKLMRWLVRLVTSPGGVVLDPFCGSGTTGVSAVIEGFDFIGIDYEKESVDTARERITAESKKMRQMPLL